MKITILPLLCALLGVTLAYNLPLSIKQCSSGGSCSTQSTSVILDGGASNTAAYGYRHVTSDGSTLTLADTARLYMMNTDGNAYQMFNFVNQELSYDIDTSMVGCGGNAALYFNSMPANGGSSGATNGGGYCDCRTNPACNELDVWEANKYATAYTTHPCDGTGCDLDGCQINPYRTNQSFYGPGSSYYVNTNTKFTVVTQFITTDNTATGALKEIKQFYIQNGQIISYKTDLTSASCDSRGHGGMAGMGNALRNGMVLTFSLWFSGDMAWLDGGSNGPCTSDSSTSGTVTFGNIKYGPIGSTNSVTPPPVTTATTATTVTTATTATTATVSTTGTITTGSPTTSETNGCGAGVSVSLNARSDGTTYDVNIVNNGNNAASSISFTISNLNLIQNSFWNMVLSGSVTGGVGHFTYSGSVSAHQASNQAGFLSSTTPTISCSSGSVTSSSTSASVTSSSTSASVTSSSSSASASSTTTGNGVVLTIHSGSDQWWVGLDISNTGATISSAKVKDSNSYATYTAMVQQPWGWQFVPNTNPLTAPLTFLVTASNGHTASASFSSITPGASVNTGVTL